MRQLSFCLLLTIFKDFAGLRAFSKILNYYYFFCEISHWAGPESSVFTVRQEYYFCMQYVKVFLFLMTIIMGFNLWRGTKS